MLMRILTSVLQIAGFTSLCYGLYQYNPWVAYVVGGSILLIVGLMADLMIKGK